MSGKLLIGDFIVEGGFGFYTNVGTLETFSFDADQLLWFSQAHR
jgi:hypothetical protein